MNKFEGIVFKSIRNIIQVTPRKSISVVSDENVKRYDNTNKLFIQPHSPYLTPTGRQKRTDLSLYCPEHGIDWRIECKARKAPNNLLGEIERDLNFVAKIPEQLFCLVLSKKIITPYFLNEINQVILEKGLTNKVWVGSNKQFKKLLKKQVK